MEITVEKAQLHLAELIDKAEAGEKVILTQGGEPIASIQPITRKSTLPRIGAFKGEIKIADDFDAPLADFKGYGNE